jgi:hypothetical protein
MKKRIINKKVMPDGLEITELFSEEEGAHNEYRFKGKIAPSIIMSDPVSLRYAAYSLIEKDLRVALFWLNEIEKLAPILDERRRNPAKMNVIKGLFVAAVTFYAKCFTTCEGRKVKLDRKLLDSDYLPIHDDVMKLRHNFTAHSGSENCEGAKVSLVLHPNKKLQAEPQLFSEIYQPDYAEFDELSFKELVEHLREVVWQKRCEAGNAVMGKVVAPKGINYWYCKAKNANQSTHSITASGGSE